MQTGATHIHRVQLEDAAPSHASEDVSCASKFATSRLLVELIQHNQGRRTCGAYRHAAIGAGRMVNGIYIEIIRLCGTYKMILMSFFFFSDYEKGRRGNILN